MLSIDVTVHANLVHDIVLKQYILLGYELCYVYYYERNLCADISFHETTCYSKILSTQRLVETLGACELLLSVANSQFIVRLSL